MWSWNQARLVVRELTRYLKKSLDMGPIFWLSPNFWHAKAPKITQFVKNGPIFQENSFSAKMTFKDR